MDEEKKKRVYMKDWVTEDALGILRGYALQCRTYEELAEMIGIHRVTLERWKAKSDDIRDAIQLGRNQADAQVVGLSFELAMQGDTNMINLWWKYRLAPKQQVELAFKDDKVIIVDDIKGE